MALTRLERTGDGTTTVYDVSFPLGFEETDVYVSLDSSEYTEQLDYTWFSSTQIQLATPVGNGIKFNIRRVVEKNLAVNDYEQGAILRESNLDDSFAQSLQILQERNDGFKPEGYTEQQNLDLGKNRITNMAQSVGTGDAINRGELMEHAEFATQRHDSTVALNQTQVINQAQIDTNQDQRIKTLEAATPLPDTGYIIEFIYVSGGGETLVETGYTFQYALVTINGVVQEKGYAFNIVGSNIVLAEELEVGDRVVAILTIPFTTTVQFDGSGNWVYMADGGETQVDVQLPFASLILAINGVLQTPQYAYNTLGSIIHLAEALQEGDVVYAVLTSG